MDTLRGYYVVERNAERALRTFANGLPPEIPPAIHLYMPEDTDDDLEDAIPYVDIRRMRFENLGKHDQDTPDTSRIPRSFSPHVPPVHGVNNIWLHYGRGQPSRGKRKKERCDRGNTNQ